MVTLGGALVAIQEHSTLAGATKFAWVRDSVPSPVVGAGQIHTHAPRGPSRRQQFPEAAFVGYNSLMLDYLQNILARFCLIHVAHRAFLTLFRSLALNGLRGISVEVLWIKRGRVEAYSI
jgi:hypothetical protein